MTENSLLTAALDLAAKGWRVLPCRPSGDAAKAPLTAHGHLDATTSSEAVHRWWTASPDALIGAVVPSTVLVFDIDPRNGGSMESLEDAFGPLPPTLTVWSGRQDGGRHLYFRRPRGRLVSDNLPDGIDLKLNGYCIMPPSLHPATGTQYVWEEGEISSLPNHAIAELRPQRQRVPGMRSIGRKLGHDHHQLAEAVAQAPIGRRNKTLYWAARRALSTCHGAPLLDELRLAGMASGLSEDECIETIQSAMDGHWRSVS